MSSAGERCAWLWLSFPAINRGCAHPLFAERALLMLAGLDAVLRGSPQLLLIFPQVLRLFGLLFTDLGRYRMVG